MAAKINLLRRNAAIAYFIIAIILFLLKTQTPKLLWAAAWTAFGIGVGLYNTRDHQGKRDKEVWHYILYDGFVFFIGAMMALIPAIYLSDAKSQTWEIRFYLPSMLIAVVIGFLEDQLYGLFPKLIRLIR